MKSINVKVHDSVLEDLRTVQAYYSSKLGVSFNQAETLTKLLSETANLIKNIGETYPGRDWTLEKQELEIHREYEERRKHE
jgi:hypothetical protein